jgi:Arsenical resistance operon trans-acting repressor ArsD.
MASFQVFDIPEKTDNRLLQQQKLAFTESVDWLRSKNVPVERFDIAANPELLKNNPAIESLVENSGINALPVILMDGKIMLVGRYPSRGELSSWAKLQHALFTFEDNGVCSGPSCG